MSDSERSHAHAACLHDQVKCSQDNIQQNLKEYSKRSRTLLSLEESFAGRKARACDAVSAKRIEVESLSSVASASQKDLSMARAQLLTTECDAKVELELLKASLDVIGKKNGKLVESRHATEGIIRVGHERLSDLKLSLNATQRDCCALRDELSRTLTDRDLYLNDKAAVLQDVDRLQNECANNQVILEAKRREANACRESKTKVDVSLRELRDKEFGLLEGLKQIQVDQARNASDLVRTKKTHQSLSRTLASMRTRSKNLSTEIEQQQEAISRTLLQNNVSREHIASAESDAKEAELKVLKLKRQMSEIQSKLTVALRNESDLTGQLDQVRVQHEYSLSDLSNLEETLASRVRSHTSTTRRHEEQSHELSELHDDLKTASSKLDYTRRKRIPDSQATVLIDSDSSLLETLQINAFLRHAQTQAYPLPVMVEKLAELLNLLASSRCQSDKALSILQERNSEATALRQVSTNIEEERYRLVTFKAGSLEKCIENQIIGSKDTTDLVLDNCSITENELKLVTKAIAQLDGAEKVTSLSLRQNLLDDLSIGDMKEVIHTLPYLSRLDLFGNFFSGDSLTSIQSIVRSIEGITDCSIKFESSSPDRISALVVGNSGKMVRLTVDMRQQRIPASKPIQNEISDVSYYLPAQSPTVLSPAEVAISDEKAPAHPLTHITKSNLPRPLDASNRSQSYIRKSRYAGGSPRGSCVSDESFVKQINLVKRTVAAKATRLGIKPSMKPS